MCIGASPPSLPPAPAPPQAPPPAPRPTDPEVRKTRDKSRQAAILAALTGGRQSTIKTSSLGLDTPANTAKQRLGT